MYCLFAVVLSLSLSLSLLSVVRSLSFHVCAILNSLKPEILKLKGDIMRETSANTDISRKEKTQTLRFPMINFNFILGSAQVQPKRVCVPAWSRRSPDDARYLTSAWRSSLILRYRTSAVFQSIHGMLAGD